VNEGLAALQGFDPEFDDPAEAVTNIFNWMLIAAPPFVEEDEGEAG
jgi:hypothetical protein